MPAGRAPLSVTVTVGVPVKVTEKLPGTVVRKVVLAELVIAGATPLMVSVKS